jgi:putative transcriptional regulator
MSVAGRILVARPDIGDARFRATLLLVLEHGEEGALAVVINRPTESKLAERFPEWEEMAARPSVLFSGGPVDPDALIALGKPAQEDGALVLGAHSVDLEAQPALVQADGVAEVRVFSGYAGWQPGQLEDELADNAWWVVDATVEDLFTADPEGLWAQVMRRQGGQLAWFAHFPADPSLN